MQVKFCNEGIVFPLFRDIVKYYFPGIPDYEVSIMFRKSWSLG